MITELIEVYAKRKTKNARALDLGAGHGFFLKKLLKEGYKVDAIEKDEKLFCELKKIRRYGIFHEDIRTYKIEQNKYNIILILNVLQFIKRKDAEKVLKKIFLGLKTGGICIISSFTTSDPSYKIASQKNEKIDTLSFKSKKGILHYWEKGELKKYLIKNKFSIIFYQEKIIQDKPHTGVPYPHKHGLVVAVIKKETISSSPSKSS